MSSVSAEQNGFLALASSDRSRALLRGFTKLVCLSTLVLIFLGGQVKSNDAGLAVPDWPLTYGENPVTFPISKWTGNIFHEHLHRIVAGTVGVLTLMMAIWLTLAENRRWVKVLGWCSVAAVVAQALLGGLTVIWMLPTAVSASHGVLAQTFFVMTIIIAYSQSKERAQRVAAEPKNTNSPITKIAFWVFAAVYLQLIIGAVMRHTESGLAIPDFPTTAGRIVPWVDGESVAWANEWRSDYGWEHGRDLPPVTLGQVWIHFAHRLGAGAILLLTGVLLYQSMRGSREIRGSGTANLVGGCVALQIALGATTIWTAKMAAVTSLHVATGAAILGLSTLLALRAHAVTLRPSDREVIEGRLKPASTL